MAINFYFWLASGNLNNGWEGEVERSGGYSMSVVIVVVVMVVWAAVEFAAVTWYGGGWLQHSSGWCEGESGNGYGGCLVVENLTWQTSKWETEPKDDDDGGDDDDNDGGGGDDIQGGKLAEVLIAFHLVFNVLRFQFCQS